MRRHFRSAFSVVLWITLSACASSTRSNIRAPRMDASALERDADAEVDRGCYLCLRSAASKYEAAISAGATGLDLKAAGAWVLLVARERELGLKPSDALERARSHSGGALGRVVDAYVLVASALPLLPEGTSMEARTEISRLSRELLGDPTRVLRERMAPPSAEASPQPAIALIGDRARQGGDLTSRYLDESVTCSGLTLLNRFGASPPGEAPEAAPPISEKSALVAFRLATCANRVEPDAARQSLNRLSQGEPRFHEAHYFLGRLNLAEGRLESAESEFFAAADGLPQMAAAWALLGTVRLTLEEAEYAAADFKRALNVEPDQRETLLKLAQALNYAGRFEEATVPARRLVEMGNWYQSDANYWLAFSELQLGRLSEADTHAREAQRTNPMNGETARLSGLVAYRLNQLDRAQTEFEMAVSRDEADCESHLHLGLIHGQKAHHQASIASSLHARDCYGALVDGATSRKADIEASALSDLRKQAAVARLAQRVAVNRRSQAAASYGAAEEAAQLGAYDAALGHAGDASLHPDFVARAAELRTRIAALRQRR